MPRLSLVKSFLRDYIPKQHIRLYRGHLKPIQKTLLPGSASSLRARRSQCRRRGLIKEETFSIYDTMKNNIPEASADWFLHLNRIELDKAITQVVSRRHTDLKLLVDAVASVVAEVDAGECHDDVHWRTLRETWSGFTDRLRHHLRAENRSLLPYATGKSEPPTREIIRQIRTEHTQLLEYLDALAQSLENLKNVHVCDKASASKLAHAADRFTDLENALNAEIFAEEIGILRRCAVYRRIS